MKLDQKLIRAWIEASNDLSIDIISPFIMELSNNTYYFVALVKDFGGEKGTLVTTYDEVGVPGDLVEESGYYWSALYPGVYTEYNRDEFIDMLNDWGWYGAVGDEPNWYTGKP